MVRGAVVVVVRGAVVVVLDETEFGGSEVCTEPSGHAIQVWLPLLGQGMRQPWLLFVHRVGPECAAAVWLADGDVPEPHAAAVIPMASKTPTSSLFI